LGHAQEVQGGANAALEHVHNYHLEWEAVDVYEEDTAGEVEENANADKDMEAVTDSEVEIVEKSRVGGQQDSDEL